MKRTTLRAVGVSALTTVALGVAVPAVIGTPAQAATAPAAKGPSVNVKDAFFGKGIVASLDVTFEYTCQPSTDRLEVTLASAAKNGKSTVLKATRAAKDLQCDGAKHAGFVEWTGTGGGAFAPGAPATATAALYDKRDTLQGKVSEKTVNLGYGVPAFGG